jgi:hypothetical protein
MSTTPAPFEQAFDSIDIDPARAPDRAAIDRAMAHVAPQRMDEPGFYLIDDCGGRFIVDRALGIVTLRDETILAKERGNVHEVQLHVVERSGARYVLAMKLRLTGLVPAMVGAEDIDFLAGAANAETRAEPKAPTTRTMLWSAYAAAAAHRAPAAIDETARFGGALDRPAPPAAPGPYRLRLFTPLPPHANKNAAWSL